MASTKTYPNGQPKPFSPRRIALSRGVFAHNYIHTNLKRHDINNTTTNNQTDNVTLKSYVDLADAYAAIGQYEIAEEKYRSALTAYNGSIHTASIISRCLCGMGAVCTDTSRFDEAKHYLLLGLKFLTAATETATNAKIAREQMEETMINVNDIMENINKDLDDWKFADLMKARTYGHMAELCRAEGNISGLILYLNKAIDTMSMLENGNELEAYAGELGNELLQFYYQLGTIYINQGLWNHVIITYESALEVVKKQLGTDSVECAECYLQIGRALEEIDIENKNHFNVKRSCKVLHHAGKIFEKQFGKGHIRTAACYEKLAKLTAAGNETDLDLAAYYSKKALDSAEAALLLDPYSEQSSIVLSRCITRYANIKFKRGQPCSACALGSEASMSLRYAQPENNIEHSKIFANNARMWSELPKFNYYPAKP